MNISILDASNYFRGLLLLIRQDRILSEPEIHLMQRVGRALGFERVYCENAIRDILDNKYVSVDLPVFSSKELAEKFVIDGLRIAHADNEVHELEEGWLLAAADANGLSHAWFLDQRQHSLPGWNEEMPLEVDRMTVRHTN